MDGQAAVGSVTILDVYTTMVEMKGQLAVMQKILEAIPDHESRLRSLEKWRYSLPFAVASAAASVGLSVWSVLHG